MGKFSKKMEGIKNKNSKEYKNKKTNNEVKKKKRTYMLTIESIKLLKMIEIEEFENNIELSQIVDEAINNYYNNYSKEYKNKNYDKEEKKKRSYTLKISTIKKLKELEVEETAEDTSLSRLVDRSIRQYYQNFYSEEYKNKNSTEVVEGQTRIEC